VLPDILKEHTAVAHLTLENKDPEDQNSNTWMLFYITYSKNLSSMPAITSQHPL